VDGDSLLSCLGRHTFLTKVREREVRILAVDDDPAALELLSGLLTPAGFTVLRATGGADGIAQARDGHPDVVLLDLMMPEVSGFEVTATLKADPATREIPIIVLTAKDLTSEDKARLNGSVATILAKGRLDRQDLLAWLGRTTRARATALPPSSAASPPDEGPHEVEPEVTA
jgi:CheY-like chemotaxis protein